MKRSNTKLTKRTVDALVFEGDNKNKQCILWDSALSGFGVRVFPSGHKSFVVGYRVQGRKRQLKIGSYGPLTVEQARDIAKERLAEASRDIDPADARLAEKKSMTFGELIDIYLKRHAANKKSGREDEQRLGRHIPCGWLNRKAKSITRAEVSELHAKIGEAKPYEANRTLALLRKMFGLAQEWGVLNDSDINPAATIKKFKEKKRDRWIKSEEMPRLAAAIDKEPHPVIRSALWLYLLTGLRKTELLKLRWSDVDFHRKELTIPETKADRVHHLPLTSEPEAVLKNLPRYADNPYVLPGRKAGEHLVNISKAWDRVRKEAGISDVRLHDIRRTVGSWLASNGASLPLIGKVLNHSNASTTQIYAHLAEDPVRAVLEDHGERIMQAAKPLRAVK